MDDNPNRIPWGRYDFITRVWDQTTWSPFSLTEQDIDAGLVYFSPFVDGRQLTFRAVRDGSFFAMAESKTGLVVWPKPTDGRPIQVFLSGTFRDASIIPRDGTAGLDAAKRGRPPLASGHKDDAEKDPWHLLPYDALREVTKVLRHGARKYAPRNWEKGMAYSRLHGALHRHLASWFQDREERDADGLRHLACVCFCALALLALSIRGKGEDDRPTG